MYVNIRLVTNLTKWWMLQCQLSVELCHEWLLIAPECSAEHAPLLEVT